MPNIEGINLSGCTNLNSAKQIDGSWVLELDVSQCSELKTLNLSGCTNFGANLETTNAKYRQVDLTKNFKIESVDARGTFVDIVLPTFVNGADSKLTSLKLGTPQSVSLLKQDSLYSNNVSCDDPNSITSITLKSESTTKTDLFKTFAQIIQNIETE